MGTNLKDISRVELIGMCVEIAEAKNQSLNGLKGKIINETKNMMEIELENGETKKIIKNQVTLKTKIKGKTVIIKGEVFQGRPEERLKKNIKI
tara:strand:+ start:516 stop:794 length:279 start_codon:yes stop_codon:yes gene_type:complete